MPLEQHSKKPVKWLRLLHIFGLQGFFALAARLSVLRETVRSHCCSEFECPCVRISTRACCFSFAHCAGPRYMVYLTRLWSTLRCWFACISCSVVEGGILLFNAMRTLPKKHKVEADCKLLHLCICALVWFDTFVVINNNSMLSFTPSIFGAWI